MTALATAPEQSTETGGVGVSCRGLVYIYRLEGYDVVALAGVDLDISPGESVALLGPSGSGKSTLLAVLAGLLAPSAGRLIVGDRDMTRATPTELAQMRASNVGVVLQGTSRNLLPYLSAEQNVRFAQRGAAGRRNGRLPAAREVLALVGLSGRGRGKLRPHQLTPGERQRLALAVALSNRPGLLLADEPTSQLDSRARDEVIAALDSVRQAGTTVVLVTHDPSVGMHMGRTITIRDGRVGAEGRRGEDFAVVGRDGSIHLPPDVLQVFAPGTLVEVRLESDGTARLVAAGGPAASGLRRAAPPAVPKPAAKPVAKPASRAAAKPATPVVAQPAAQTGFFDPGYVDPQYRETQYVDAQYAQPQYGAYAAPGYQDYAEPEPAPAGQAGAVPGPQGQVPQGSRSGLADLLRRDQSSTEGFDYWGDK